MNPWSREPGSKNLSLTNNQNPIYWLKSQTIQLSKPLT